MAGVFPPSFFPLFLEIVGIFHFQSSWVTCQCTGLICFLAALLVLLQNQNYCFKYHKVQVSCWFHCNLVSESSVCVAAYQKKWHDEMFCAEDSEAAKSPRSCPLCKAVEHFVLQLPVKWMKLVNVITNSRIDSTLSRKVGGVMRNIEDN